MLLKPFGNHEKAKYWSNKNIDENGIFIDPKTISSTSRMKYLFDCIECNHTFLKRVCDITRTDSSSWCNYCSHSVLCNNENCIKCFENSFASYEDKEKLACWSKDNIDKDGNLITPRNIFKNSKVYYKFICKGCNHDIVQRPANIIRNIWCIYCAHLKLCDEDNCIFCFENSFASTPEAIYWHEDNKLTPRQVFKNAHTKYDFNCNKCLNKFTQFPQVIFKEKSTCQLCVRQTESKVYRKLKIYYPDIIYNFYADWCRNETTNSKLPFDFLLEDKKIIIELDGEQHFTQVRNWLNVEECRRRDLFKMKCANDNGYSIIRIYQKDVLKDKINWIQILQESIQDIVSKNIIQNHFIAFDENKYKDFIFQI